MFNGLYASDNAKAALITMGLNEIQLFCGASIETLNSFTD
ncbi:hypothetical protein MNU24_03540 [Spiroplasma poulsonii]|nr:hypothetical protein MNU24_03540 [Spiroplasma poulsonii]